MAEGDDITTGRTLESANGLHGLVGGAVGHQDAVGTVEAQAVGTGQQQRILKELQTDWAGQLRLQCFHLQAKQSGVVSEIQGS